jgi:hypothetical protein
MMVRIGMCGNGCAGFSATICTKEVVSIASKVDDGPEEKSVPSGRPNRSPC